MKELTGPAWVIIIFFVTFVILINVWLFLFAKDKNAIQGIKILSETVKVLKNPFQDEDKKNWKNYRHSQTNLKKKTY